jgi:hypothetical protein
MSELHSVPMLCGLGSASRPVRRRATRSALARVPHTMATPMLGGGVTGRRHPGQGGRLRLTRTLWDHGISRG